MIPTVFSHLSIGIIVVDPQFTIVDVNEAATKILGLQRDDLVGKKTNSSDWNLMFPEGGICPWESYPVNQTLMTGKPVREVTLGIPVPGKDQPAWLQISAEPVPGENGHPGMVVCSFDDITRVKNAELTIRDNEERYRLLIEQTGQILYDYDLRSGQIIWSGAIETITGASPEEFRSVNSEQWEAMIHPDDQDMASSVLYESMKSGNRYHMEYRLRKKSGEYLYVEDNGIFIRDSGEEVIRMLGTLKDVSDRRRSIEMIRDNEERFRSLIESARDVIFTLAPNGAVTSLNSIFETMTGWERQEWVGKPIINLFHPDDLPESMQLFTSALHGSSNILTEKRIRLRDGEYASCEVTIMPQIMRGQVVGVLGFIRDITHRKKMEDHLRQAQKMDSIGTLAGGIAHDFNNLLNIMVGNIHLLSQDAGLSEKGRKRLESISKAADRGTGLVRQLLTFAKKGDLLLEPINLNIIIQDLVKLLEETFPKNIAIRLELVNEIPILLADANQLHQVFLNLCVNARDAMPEGGTLTIGSQLVSKAAVDGKDATLNHDRYIEISVTDTGMGMDESTRQRIFEPFFTTKGSGKGTGLGLSVVFGILQNHRGHIAVTSSPGNGTRFSVYFPVPETLPESESGETAASEDTPGGTETILLVEDEWMIREIIASMLEEKGYTVLQAEDGQMAVETFTAQHAAIDLIVSDLEMPRLGGRDAFLQMKQIKPSQAAIVVSGFINPELRVELTKAGVKALIHKPFRPDNLLKIIRRILDSQ